MNRVAGTLSAVGVTALLAAAAVALAQGGEVKVDSEVSIRHDPPRTFEGKVTADNANCVEGRKVVLMRYFLIPDSRGFGDDGPGARGEKVGADVTNGKGKWRIRSNRGSAGIPHFYATVKPTEQGTAGTIYACGSAVSKTITP